MFKRLIPDRFLLFMIATVLLATFLPPDRDGAVVVSTISSVAIFMLFFLHGAKISTAAILEALAHWRLHGMILSFTFILFPLLAFALHAVAGPLLTPELWVGVLFMCALPSTVQSSIAFTSMAKGNVAGAVAAASMSQILGVFITPLLMGLVASGRGMTLDLSGLEGVMIQILLPFALGQVARRWIGAALARHKSAVSIADRSTILIAIYSAFSAAVRDGIWHRVDAAQLGMLAGVCVFILVVMLVLTFMAGRAAGLSREDRIVVQFCGTKKSLVQGIPMARVLFSGPAAGMALLPIMIFHQFQLMACGWIASRYARNVVDD